MSALISNAVILKPGNVATRREYLAYCLKYASDSCVVKIAKLEPAMKEIAW